MSAAASAPGTDEAKNDLSGESTFSKVFAAFCSDLSETFPELADSIRRVEGKASPLFFWNSWKHDLLVLARKDFEALQAQRKGILVLPIVMTPTLWSEISSVSQLAIWRYLRTLILEAVMELQLDSTNLTDERMNLLMIILTEERGQGDINTLGEAIIEEEDAEIEPHLERLQEELRRKIRGDPPGDDVSGYELPAHLKGFVEKFAKKFTDASGVPSMFGKPDELPTRLKGMIGTLSRGMFDSSGLDTIFGASGEFPIPEIPEHLRKGRIAHLAEEMVRQINPAEFGIDPAIFEGDDVGAAIQKIMEVYQRDPSKIINGAKKVAEKIKRQLVGGSLDINGLSSEAKEFIELFRNHPAFKGAIEQLEGLFGAGGLAEMFSSAASAGSGDGGASSERLRAVQERLRKKLAARDAAKKAGGGSK